MRWTVYPCTAPPRTRSNTWVMEMGVLKKTDHWEKSKLDHHSGYLDRRACWKSDRLMLKISQRKDKSWLSCCWTLLQLLWIHEKRRLWMKEPAGSTLVSGWGQRPHHLQLGLQSDPLLVNRLWQNKNKQQPPPTIYNYNYSASKWKNKEIYCFSIKGFKSGK